MELFFLNKCFVEYACLCGITSPLTKLYFCRHCLNLRCAFCCHHEVSKNHKNQIFQFVTHFFHRSIPTSARTVSRTYLRRRPSLGRTNATPVSTVHRANRRSQLARLRFKFRWRRRAKAAKKPQNPLKWSRRRCITWRVSHADGRPVTLASATKLPRPARGRSRNISTILDSRCS